MPDDEILIELDASGQEARLLAEVGNVESLLNLFHKGQKVHGVMAAAIAGLDYETFMAYYKKDGPLGKFAGPEGFYYCGKFINLSMQYRVGAKTQRIQARTDYNLRKSAFEIMQWRDIYHHAHPGVQVYWKAAEDRTDCMYGEADEYRQLNVQYMTTL